MSSEVPEEEDRSTERQPKRHRSDPKFYISFMPDGRGGPREDKGSVPLDIEVEAHIEERTDCLPGLYRIEKKRGGEFSGEVLFYEKVDIDSAAAIGDFDDDGGSDGAPDIRKLVASTVAATLDAKDRRERPPDPMEQFRQMRELLKEEREEMQRQLQQQSGGSPDPLAMFERFVELQKKLQPQPVKNADPEMSAKDRAQLMLVKESGLIPEFMRSMKDLLRAPEEAVEPKGFLEQALDFLNGWTPHLAPVLAPALGRKISEVVSRVNTEAIADRINTHPGIVAASSQPVQPVNTPSESVEPSQSSIEADLHEAMQVVVDCITLDTDDSDGEEHRQCAFNAVQSFLEKNPMAQPAVTAMFSQASGALVLQLASAKPEWAYVAKLGNASRFISDLKEMLMSAGEEEGEHTAEAAVEIATATPSANGAKSAAGVRS